MKRWNPSKLLIGATAVLALIAVTMLSGCGGGGSTSGVVNNTPPGTTIVGTVSKGPFFEGYVECYFISGTIEAYQSSVAIQSDGSYSLNIGNHTGVVLLKAYGRYTDEATNYAVEIRKGRDLPLRASRNITAPAGSATVVMSITALTELAVRDAFNRSTDQPPTLTQQNITDANTLITTLFNLDILATRPVRPNSADLLAADDFQKCYTLVLSGISKSAPTPTALNTLLSGYQTDINQNDHISAANITALINATQAFLDSGVPYNQTGYTNTTQIPRFPYIGYYYTVITLSTAKNSGAGNSAANLLQFSLYLSDTALFVENNTNVPIPGVITLLNSQIASLGDSPAFLVTDSTTGRSVLNVGLINNSGFSTTDGTAFMTVRIRTAPGFAQNPATSILVKHLYQNGAEDTQIPYASINDDNTTALDWSINIAY